MARVWFKVVAVCVFVAAGAAVSAAGADAQSGPPVDCGPGWVLIGDTCFNQTTTTASLVGDPVPGKRCYGDFVWVDDHCEYRPATTQPTAPPPAPEPAPTPAPPPSAPAPTHAPPATRTTQPPTTKPAAEAPDNLVEAPPVTEPVDATPGTTETPLAVPPGSQPATTPSSSDVQLVRTTPSDPAESGAATAWAAALAVAVLAGLALLSVAYRRTRRVTEGD